MRGSTSWSTYLRGGWVDAVSVHGALDVCGWYVGWDDQQEGGGQE